MRDFKKPFGGNRGGGGGGFNRANAGAPRFGGGGRPNRGDDGFRRSEMFEAVCANCGKRCEVPFRPNGQKPVYCRDCFGKQEHAPAPSGGGYPRKDFNARPPFRAPGASPEHRDTRIDDIKRQLDAVAMKLDQLLNASRSVSSTERPAPKAMSAAPGPKPLIVEVKTPESAKPISSKPAKAFKKKAGGKKR